MVEYPLPADSGPHGLTEDAAGNVWFTGISQNYIGMLDPQTGEVTQYPLPEGRGPHTPVFDRHGTLWFTLQSGMVGRLVPATGEITIVATPSAHTYPYGIVSNSEGVLWYTDYARGYQGRFDPETGEVEEWASPGGPESRPYGIATVGTVVWYSESAVRPNTLVRFDTETERFQTWAIPSGGGVVRNMMATADGNLVLACSAVNRVALVDIGH